MHIRSSELLLKWLKKNSPSHQRALDGLGGFSSLFQPALEGIKNPCLSAACDGVGTKLKLGVQLNSYEGIGQDLVAMCVNDLICSGARPLFFMDYYACGKLNLKPAKQFLKGVLKACQKSSCILLGGETAEMPDCYQGKDFDCAGFALGIVDKDKTLGPHKVKTGDFVIGINSSGFHSNGFSLLRKVFKKSEILKRKNLFLKPTALYAALALKLFPLKGLKAIAHITGGGLDNILRILPPYSQAELLPWKVPQVFKEVKKRAEMREKELLKTLNCGLGLILIVSKKTNLDFLFKLIKKEGFLALNLGSIKPQKNQKPSWRLLNPLAL